MLLKYHKLFGKANTSELKIVDHVFFSKLILVLFTGEKGTFGISIQVNPSNTKISNYSKSVIRTDSNLTAFPSRVSRQVRHQQKLTHMYTSADHVFIENYRFAQNAIFGLWL